jgi:Zn-dependent protease/CBS domain-containing protein
MFQNSLTIGRIAGIRIAVHYTWLFVFLLVTWSLAGGYFPSTYPRWDPVVYWVAGAAASLLLFASVLIHELGHSLVALTRGVRVDSITLFIFGGVSALRDEPRGAIDEFLIAVAGPLTSLLLAALFYVLGQALAGTGAPGAVVAYMATINLMLGLFNLLPGFPLDGGRVLRAILWAATGSLHRATQIASYVGQGIALLLIVLGLVQLLAGNFLNGLWIAFIGWFLNGAAEQTRHAQQAQESLAGISVAQLMDPQPLTASPAMPVDEFVYNYVLRQGRRALPVSEDGRLVGLVSTTDVKPVPRTEWAHTAVGQIMTRAPLRTVTPQTGLREAMHLLAEGDYHQLPVVDDAGRLVGMISRADILRYMRFRDAAGRPVPAPPPVSGDRPQPTSAPSTPPA